MYALRDVAGKGKGLVAIENIPRGTRILSEEPIIVVPAHENFRSEELRKSICQQVDALSEHQRQGFLSMHNLHKYNTAAEQYLGIVRSNGIPIGADQSSGGVFLEACFINHSCDNNSHRHWNEEIKRHTVHALRDIQKGDEITVHYLAVNKEREYRQAALQTNFAFTCSCRICSLPPEQSEENDKILQEIYLLDSLIDQGTERSIHSSALQFLALTDRQVRLHIKQGGENHVGLSRAFWGAAQMAVFSGEFARGLIFIERAVSAWRIALGSDSRDVLEGESLLRELSSLKNDLSGTQMECSRNMDDVPNGLEPSDFEDWLWRREKPNTPRDLVNLRNRRTFPGFRGLPHQNGIDMEFYKLSVMNTYRPRFNWCFLGEIVDLASLIRLHMEVRDVNDKTLPLFFYTEGRGHEVAPTKLQKGYTVAILYAERHSFLFDEPGIRHEYPELLTVC